MTRAALLLLFLYLFPAPAQAAPALVTEAERSGFVRTGRYAEVEKLCAAFAAAEPTRVRCITFGRTPEGRPMLAMVASADGVLDPTEARRRGRPTILVQGGIHAGEIEGKDAIFWTLRELLEGKTAPGALAAVTLVLVPVFNVDGHERFGPANRPNQRGPEEMGWRATAQNLNLNRDYVKADAPEMLAMLRLFEAWDPVVYVDLHATDGAKFEHDVAVMVAPATARPDGLDEAGAALSAQLQAGLTARKHLPLSFYPSFRSDTDPTSGVEVEDTPPRFSQAYAAARNRLGILVETHSWKSYRERALATRDLLAVLLEGAVHDAAAWRKAADDADERGARLGGSDVTLLFEHDGTSRMFDFRGYTFQVARSELSGQDWVRYDERKPTIWRMPILDRMRPRLTVRAPGAGYVVPAAHATLVAAKLRAHGLRFELLPRAHAALPVERFEVTETTFESPREGRLPLVLKGSWRAQRRDLPPGSLFVPIAQPRARLVMHLLEPTAPDSLVSWGFFNASFERKEYLEAYVLEEEARKMLARDPALEAEFERRLRDDPAFAGSPARRLQFFHRRHPSWDREREGAPVLRVDHAPR